MCSSLDITRNCSICSVLKSPVNSHINTLVNIKYILTYSLLRSYNATLDVMYTGRKFFIVKEKKRKNNRKEQKKEKKKNKGKEIRR